TIAGARSPTCFAWLPRPVSDRWAIWRSIAARRSAGTRSIQPARYSSSCCDRVVDISLVSLVTDVTFVWLAGRVALKLDAPCLRAARAQAWIEPQREYRAPRRARGALCRGN